MAQVVVATFDWRGQVQNSWAFLRFLGQHTEFYEALGSSNFTSGRNIAGPLCPFPYFCTLSYPSVTSSTTSNDFPLASCLRPFFGKFHHVFPSGDNPLHFREILSECLGCFQSMATSILTTIVGEQSSYDSLALYAKAIWCGPYMCRHFPLSSDADEVALFGPLSPSLETQIGPAEAF